MNRFDYKQEEFKDNELENVIETIQGVIENLGYDHKRISEMDNLDTTQYDGIVFKGTGREYNISFDISRTYNTTRTKWESTNYLDIIVK